ncbi:MAG: Xaa-Pro aminopeptidase, partial [Chloroflexi bacterium]|nr:Xaa-Pro aminopeptidase [Chloroflexota bacterium]
MNLDLPTSASYRSAAVLPLRQRAEVTTRILRERLDNLLPALMRETGYDMWLV